MKEHDLQKEISRIASASTSLNAALSGIESLLASEWGGALLTIRPSLPGPSSPIPGAIAEFLESRQFPFRGLYFVPISTGGTLAACIGTWGEPSGIFPRAIRFAADRLGKINVYAEAA